MNVEASTPPQSITQIASPEQLVAAREARGWSMSDVAAKLGMMPRQIEAIEQGRWEALPGHAFVRGAIRAYGKALQLDVAPLLATLGPKSNAPELRPSSSLDSPLPRHGALGFDNGGSGSRIVWILLGVIGVVAIAMYFGRGADFGQALDVGNGSASPGRALEVVPVAPGAASDAAAGGGAASGAAPAGGATASPATASPATSPAAGAPAGSAASAGAALSTGAAPSTGSAAPTSSAASTGPAASSSTSTGVSSSATPGASGAGGAVASTPVAGAGSPGSPRSGAAATGTAATGTAAPGSPTLPAVPATPGADASGAGDEATNSASAADAAAPASGAAPTGAAGAPTPAADSLVLRFERESWVDVRDATGKVLLMGTQPANSTREVSGQKPYSMTIGNATFVRVEHDGRNVDLGAVTQKGVARVRVE